jgi:hypothetical protein
LVESASLIDAGSSRGWERSLLAIVIITSDGHHERTFASGADSVTVSGQSQCATWHWATGNGYKDGSHGLSNI